MTQSVSSCMEKCVTKQEAGHLDPSGDLPAGVSEVSVVTAHIIKLMHCVKSFAPSLSSFTSLHFVCGEKKKGPLCWRRRPLMTEQCMLVLSRGRCWQRRHSSQRHRAGWLVGGLVCVFVGRRRTVVCFVIQCCPPAPPRWLGHLSSDRGPNYPPQLACNDIKIEAWMGHQSQGRGSADPESSTRGRWEEAGERMANEAARRAAEMERYCKQTKEKEREKRGLYREKERQRMSSNYKK